MSIFVSIASYRDPELPVTISDCLEKARFPEDLRFGICWQHASDETPLAVQGDSRFRILDCDWQDSQGCCWARAEIMKLWDGEDYFLQIDSHHRFADHWDEKLIGIAARTGSQKPLITTYCPGYEPGTPPDSASAPTQIEFDCFTHGGVPLFKPGYMLNSAGHERPLRARFVSGHFLFAPGSFVAEVPYDPDLYFHGEEIMLTVRAWTWGYDLFHPPEVLLWHEYTRQYRRKHWDDHVEGSVDMPWYVRDQKSLEKIGTFLKHPIVGPFGCGPQRSLLEYAQYAGIDFERERIQAYTRQALEPPNPPAADEPEEELRTWRIRMELEIEEVQGPGLTDIEFWYVGFHDEGKRELYRNDASYEELAAAKAGGSGRIVIERQFESDRTPRTWTIWPFSRAGGWLRKVDGPLSEGDWIPLMWMDVGSISLSAGTKLAAWG